MKHGDSKAHSKGSDTSSIRGFDEGEGTPVIVTIAEEEHHKEFSPKASGKFVIKM
jgi:hypothetical protein